MICISINQESRRLAVVDMMNAAPQGDLLEVRLDRFGMAPGLSELLSLKPKPVIMCCRRKCDGGHWDGHEDERLALLRQCIVSKADYVEIELDVADQIRPFPPAKRVISYTNLEETPADIARIYAEAQTKKPDVIKLTTLARTPEEAWPLVQILAKPPVPTVVVGLGRPGMMLALLARKIGAPWTYAALERGMEAWPGQPTVEELRDVYHYGAIERGTRLIGVTGFGEREMAIAAVHNAVLAHHKLAARCLPLGVGSVRLFRKVVEAVKLAALVVDEEHERTLMEMVGESHLSAEQAEGADVLLFKGEKWHGYHTGCQAVVAALATALKAKGGGAEPIKGRIVAIVGLNAVARGVAGELDKRGASVILASHKKKAVQEMAQALGCRHILFEALYSTMHDVLIVCDEEKEEFKNRPGLAGVHPGYLKPGITVLDLTAGMRKSTLVREAVVRGCNVVLPSDLLLDRVELQSRLFTGKQTPREVLAKALPRWLQEEEQEEQEKE
ncbi:MAG TPA: type I 3-dehydroquinate dehydratase [Gemmataceae bacterium]|nr:type I 3-dehydroquinate dehydratase [Gemmataceae bacterium]